MECNYGRNRPNPIKLANASLTWHAPIATLVHALENTLRLSSQGGKSMMYYNIRVANYITTLLRCTMGAMKSWPSVSRLNP